MTFPATPAVQSPASPTEKREGQDEAPRTRTATTTVPAQVARNREPHQGRGRILTTAATGPRARE